MLKITSYILFLIILILCGCTKSVGYASSTLYYDEPQQPVIIKIIKPSTKKSVQNPSLTSSTSIKDKNVQITKLVVSPEDSTLNAYSGKTIQFTATAYDNEGNIVPVDNFKWESMDEKTAIVSSTGLVTILKTGKFFIKASVNNITGLALLTVTSDGSDSSSSSSNSSNSDVKVDIIWD